MDEQTKGMWEGRWSEGRTAWHKDQVNPHLEEFFGRFEGNVEGKRILVPMCGKSIDLAWLHGKGMHVVGVEFVERPIREFFEEHNMEYTVEEQPSKGYTVYKHGDRLTVYRCDVFTVSEEMLGARCDFLWDRGALVAIGYEHKARYSGVIQSVLAPHAEGLVEAMSYDRSLHPGPPYSTSEEDVVSFFSSRCAVEKLSDRKTSEIPKWYASSIAGLADADWRTFYLKVKGE